MFLNYLHKLLGSKKKNTELQRICTQFFGTHNAILQLITAKLQLNKLLNNINITTGLIAQIYFRVKNLMISII
jgi:hypothetical protein